jgi:hypothetical protein
MCIYYYKLFLYIIITIIINYNLEINNLDTYNLKIIGKNNCENKINNRIINKKP